MSSPPSSKTPSPGSSPGPSSPGPSGGQAYQGAVEATLAVVIAIGLGHWADQYFGTGPWGLLIGAVLGFAAMVLRLVRLGKDLNPGDDDNTGPRT